MDTLGSVELADGSERRPAARREMTSGDPPDAAREREREEIGT